MGARRGRGSLRRPLVDHIGDEAAEFVVRQYLRSAFLLLRLPAGRERQAELGAPSGADLV